MPIKLLSWNVNGLRACGRTEFGKWFTKQKADVVCVQEIKATPEQLTPELLNPCGYHSFWHPAEKLGYSGVAVFSKREPLEVRVGMGRKDIDREGRVLALEFKNFTVISTYFPNSQRDHARLGYKLDFCSAFLEYCAKERRRGKTVIICGDLNIAHHEIDLKNPKSNMKNAGFLPEERAWMSRFLEHGYVDCFRRFTEGPGHYTWWSYRPGVRERNIGWRLDYFLADAESKGRLMSVKHQTSVMGSDHCPVSLELKS
jgi:exodeoxyribonuclease-3